MGANPPEALRTLHETNHDFLSQFILYFDGEKDPRNLMVVFSILRVPMTEWEIGADAQVTTPLSHGSDKWLTLIVTL